MVRKIGAAVIISMLVGMLTACGSASVSDRTHPLMNAFPL